MVVNHSWVQFLYYDNQVILDRSKYLGSVPPSYKDTLYTLLSNEHSDDPPPQGVENKYWDQRFRLFSKFQQYDFSSGEHLKVTAYHCQYS